MTSKKPTLRTWLWVTLLLLVAVAIGLGIWTYMRPQAAVGDCTGVEIYDYDDYNTSDPTRPSACLTVGEYNTSDLTALNLNNAIASIKVDSGFKATLYEDDLLASTGDSLVVTTDLRRLDDIQASNLGGWDDITSSIKVETAPACVVSVYDGQDYYKYGTCLPVGEYNKASLEARGMAADIISSIRVKNGYKVVGYDLDNFVSNTSFDFKEFTSDVADLNTIPFLGGIFNANWDGRIASLKVMSATTPPTEVTLTATPITVASGGTVTLNWTNATSACTALPVTTPPWFDSSKASGSATVTPDKTTTYKLTCGNVVKQVAVTVTGGTCPELTADLAGNDCEVNGADWSVMGKQWWIQ